MNRIYRLVFNHSTGMMQVASELTRTPALHSQSASAPARRRSTLSAAMLVALGLSVASLPSAFAQAYEYTANEDITGNNVFVDGFRVGPAQTAMVRVTGASAFTSNDLVSIGTTATGDGELHFTGPGATLTINGASLRAGDAGMGALRLYDGATTTVGQTTTFGYAAGSSGVGQIDTGSTLTTRQLLVGRQGNAALTLANGGRVETTLAANPPALSFGASLGVEQGSVGTVGVYSGSELVITGNELRVGEAGTGNLTVDDATVTATTAVTLGSQDGGKGTVRVQNGGQLTTALVDIGKGQGGTGTMTVSGAGSAVNADLMRVSSNGDGSLRVEDGATVTVTGNITAESDQGIPSSASRVGLIEVSGAGSVLSGDRVSTTTHLLVDNGGEIVSNSGRVFDSYSNTGTATLTGAGSRWTNGGELDVRARLDVLDGAVIRTDSLLVSGGLNSITMKPVVENDQVRVTGAGSAIEATGDITVGRHLVGEPFGLLSVSNGGRVAAGGTLILGTSGYVSLGGGMDHWDSTVGEPVWAAAEAAGTLDVGTLQFNSTAGGLVFNHTGNITLGHTLRSDTANDNWTSGALTHVAGLTTLDGNLADFGGDVNVSGGWLTINGDMYTGQDYTSSSQAFAQQIDIIGGTLVLNGSSGFQQTINYGSSSEVIRSSNVMVRGSGVLGGTGTVGTTHVINGGTLSPGQTSSGTGVFTVDGDLFLNSGMILSNDVAKAATYDVQLRANGEADLVKVTGTAYIGSKANYSTSGQAEMRVGILDMNTSYQTEQTYTVLEAAEGIQGGFDRVVTNTPFLQQRVTQVGNQVQLTVSVDYNWTDDPDPVDPGNPVDPGTPVDPGNPTNPVPPVTPVAPGPIVFGRVAVTGNHIATAAALDSLQQSGDALALYNNLLMLDEASALAAFDELAGEMHASNRALLLDDRFLREGISQRLRPAAADAADGASVWAAGSGSSARQDGDGTAASTRNHRQGLMAGVDWSFGEAWTVGVAGGPESLRQQIRGRNATTDVDAVHGGLYAGFRAGQAWMNAGASYADYDVETERSIGAGTAWGQTLNSRYDAHAVTAFAEGGWDLAMDKLTLTPYLAMAYTRLSTEASMESGGNAALAVAASKDEVWTTTAGVRAAWDISGGQRDGARLEAGLAWQNAAGELRADSRNQFVAGSDSFTISGLPLARNVGIAEVGVSLKPTDTSRLSFFAQGRSGDGLSEFGAQVNWTVQF
jgi:T5SS/PEP-CTERM-associated repeat protein